MGYGRAILCAELRGILDHARHRAADVVTVRRRARFEKIVDILLAPVGETFLRDVGDETLAFRIRPAGEALRSYDATEEIARAMTLRAMTERVDEIGAA